jgi:hypothetical protein
MQQARKALVTPILGFALLFGFVISAFAETLPLLPNHTLTPGLARTYLTLDQICNTKWGKDERAVTAAMKKAVFKAYGLTGNSDPACIPDASGRHCEIDHLISREIGGADDVKNLWPQPYGSQPWNATRKDCVENRLHKEVCAGHITLKQAQDDISSDWTAVYLRYYDPPMPGQKCAAKKN